MLHFSKLSLRSDIYIMELTVGVSHLALTDTLAFLFPGEDVTTRCEYLSCFCFFCKESESPNSPSTKFKESYLSTPLFRSLACAPRNVSRS